MLCPCAQAGIALKAEAAPRPAIRWRL